MKVTWEIRWAFRSNSIIMGNMMRVLGVSCKIRTHGRWAMDPIMEKGSFKLGSQSIKKNN